MPKIGYGSDSRTRFMMPNGLRKVTIKNVKELEMLMAVNKSYAAEIAHAVGARKRIVIVKRAQELGIKLTNPNARLIASENS